MQGWSTQSFKYFSKSFPMWVGCSTFWQSCISIHFILSERVDGWWYFLTPQSVPRSNNLTSSPDKRGFPTRNAASLSSYLSCLLPHHITTKQKQHWQTQHHNTTRISSLLLSFLLLHHTVLNNTQQPQQHTTTHNNRNNTDNQNHNDNNKNNTDNQKTTLATTTTTTSQNTSSELNYFMY